MPDSQEHPLWRRPGFRDTTEPVVAPIVDLDPLIAVLRDIRDELHSIDTTLRETPWRDVVHAIREIS